MVPSHGPVIWADQRYDANIHSSLSLSASWAQTQHEHLSWASTATAEVTRTLHDFCQVRLREEKPARQCLGHRKRRGTAEGNERAAFCFSCTVVPPNFSHLISLMQEEWKHMFIRLFSSLLLIMFWENFKHKIPRGGVVVLSVVFKY